MKAGYYLSEYGNFQIWYPMEDGSQRMEVFLENSTGEWTTMMFTKKQVQLLLGIVDPLFLGDL